MTVTICHNPACGTSRNVPGLISNSGEEPIVIEYLRTSPSRDGLISLIGRMAIPVHQLRQKGTPYYEPGLDAPALTPAYRRQNDASHFDQLANVVTPLGVKLCRPSKTALDILPSAQRCAFCNEDGQPDVVAQGKLVRGLTR